MSAGACTSEMRLRKSDRLYLVGVVTTIVHRYATEFSRGFEKDREFSRMSQVAFEIWIRWDLWSSSVSWYSRCWELMAIFLSQWLKIFVAGLCVLLLSNWFGWVCETHLVFCAVPQVCLQSSLRMCTHCQVGVSCWLKLTIRMDTMKLKFRWVWRSTAGLPRPSPLPGQSWPGRASVPTECLSWMVLFALCTVGCSCVWALVLGHQLLIEFFVAS